MGNLRSEFSTLPVQAKKKLLGTKLTGNEWWVAFIILYQLDVTILGIG